MRLYSTMDYQLDVSGGSCLAVCRHCRARFIRADGALARRVALEHVAAVHAEDPAAVARAWAGLGRRR